MLRKAREGKIILPPLLSRRSLGLNTIDCIDSGSSNVHNPDKSAITGHRHTFDDPSIVIDEGNDELPEEATPVTAHAIDTYRSPIDTAMMPETAIDKLDSAGP
jgi:hypothetical protein